MTTENRTPRYWLSLEQYENSPASVEAAQTEFTSSPIREGAESEGIERRDFLKLMGAGAAMASFAGCTRRPVQKIVPYVTNPEEIVPGVPNFYASACPETGYGLLVKTREGRPIKVDGNSDHPMNGNGLHARGQAMILDLYDPDRLRAPRIQGKEVSWQEFNIAVGRGLAATRGQVHLLTGTVMSPSLLALIDKLNLKHTMVDALPMDDVLEGQEKSYGTRVLPRYRFDKADYIVSVDADFLDTWISPAEFQSQFASRRKLDNSRSTMSKFVAFESAMRLTGQNADERIAISPSYSFHVAAALAHEVSRLLGRSAAELAAYSPAAVAKKAGIKAEAITEAARGLANFRGRSLVVAGSVGGKGANAVATQIVVNYLNSLLGNEGVTVDGTLSPSNQFKGSCDQLARLINAMNAGEVKVLIIQGVNPIYAFADKLGFAEALKKVTTVVYVGRYEDETARASAYVAAESHPFEAWGDVNPQRDLYSICQPTIQPLWQTKSLLSLLIDWSGALGNTVGGTDHDFVKSQWQALHKRAGGGDFTSFWEDTLQSGVLDFKKGSRDQNASARNFRAPALRELNVSEPNSGDGVFELVLLPTVAMADGSQSNSSLLQELPDPVTKITWGNYVSLAPETAQKMGIEDGDVLAVELNGEKVELPAHRQPGLFPGVLVSQLGYGRKFLGRVGDGVGQRWLHAVSVKGGHPLFAQAGVKVSKTGRKEPLACTQGHHSMEGRDIAFETTLEEFRKDPASGIVHHMEKLDSLWSGHEYKGYKWGMAIDMSSCTGCSACVVACSVENNVPNVGKEQVLKGRVMHWIRIDRYYSGDAKDPEVIYQPMLCQHCDNAPCETVCPVIATVHSDDGLNQMIYNRCVGTKYCSNNCPYKVRRFNWFNNNGDMNAGGEHPIPLAKNPEVTLRSRGVMEKCTFCVQRIEAAKHTTRLEGRRIADKDLRTACQDACPSDAIVFGDLNNPESRVAKLHKHPRGFQTLEELNTKPAVTYLTKVRNRPAKHESEAGHHG